VCGASAIVIRIASAGTEGVKAIVGITGDVKATYLGSSAGYNDSLLLNGQLIFNNKTTPIGTVVDLGYFLIGTELNFLLTVSDTRMGYFTGAASKNADKHAHARVQSDWDIPGTTLVSFEDLWGGPFNYNDLSFLFQTTSSDSSSLNSQVPEPGSLALVLTALAGVTVVRQRRKM